jgi:LmbE family N-acetylglucosaminyl deacetylase
MTMMRPISLLFAFLLLTFAAPGESQAPPLLRPDARYKADVLIVVAHPDDDVVVGGYLARISLDERKRIAVVYCTTGDGGGNAVGYEAGAALGQMRILEARRALGAWGIENVWFLTGHDTPGQNVLWSLDSWNHGRALDDIVRLVRLTRPDVVMTWLPDYVVGENHDDHQASGVLATEAFDLAGDPTRFPEQVSPPRNRTGMMNLTEGLGPWQPQKLYYFTDAFEDFGPYWHDPAQLSPFRRNMMDGSGPTYGTTTISPSRHVSYARLTVDQQLFYQTQEADIGERALKSQSFKDFEYPVRLIFGKSLVGGSVTGDVFENVSETSAPFVRVRGYEPQRPSGLSFEIGDPWRFYSLFWRAHNLDHLAELIPVPEAAARFGDKLHIALLACNHTADASEITMTAALPAGWRDQTPFTRYPVRPEECYPIQAQIVAPASGKPAWQQLQWSATAGSRPVGSVTVRVYVGADGGLPQ